MPRFTSIVIDPIYRRLLGPPAVSWYGHGQGQTPHPDNMNGSRGLVVVADGVGGFDLCSAGLAHVMGAAKLPHAILVFSWGHGLGRWHADLTDVAHRDAMAQSMADSIAGFRTDRPGEPVFLVAKSGGSGIAVKALEPSKRTPSCASSCWRRRYRPATTSRVLSALCGARWLCSGRRSTWSFWAPATRVFGTIDRVRSSSAGLVGFKKPADGPADGNQRHPYDKLRQIRWGPRMATTGYLGGHFGPDSPLFLRKYVVPLLRVDDSTSC